jgi:ADP-heptose:LPS heptosyltransferase
MELNPTMHATDAFAKKLGVSVEDHKPVFRLSELELAGGLTRFPRTKSMRVGIQPLASVANRDYPLPYWMEVIDKLVYKEHCEVFLFGAKGQIPPVRHIGITNLSEHDLTFRQSAAILATCDVFAGVDSSLLPVCHAIDMPAVGLYGPFDWKTRTAKAPLTWALQGAGECAPCHWHRHAGRSFPPTKDCAKLGNCHVLASIKPERIVAKLLSIPRRASAN